MISIFIFEVIKEGKGRETRPVTGQLVTLKIVAKLEDGTCVENHDELSFILGDEDVIQGKLQSFNKLSNSVWFSGNDIPKSNPVCINKFW